MKYIIKPASILFITAVITVALLSLVFNLTEDTIKLQRERTQREAMKEILPQASEYRNLNVNKTGSIVAVYEGISGNSTIGYVVQLSPNGYSGNIDLMVGISISDKKITGMRVLHHTETPGLGAKAVKENFYRRYDNKALVPLRVTRTYPGENEIQAITSATITTRAITNAVNEAIEWYVNNAGENKE